MVLDLNVKDSLLKLHVSQFPLLKKRDNNSIHFLKLLCKLNELIHGKHSAAFILYLSLPLAQDPLEGRTLLDSSPIPA